MKRKLLIDMVKGLESGKDLCLMERERKQLEEGQATWEHMDEM